MNLLETRQIKKSFRLGFRNNKEVLKGVEFSINKGDFACITGRSGAGKTTFLKIIAGILKPSSGEMFFNRKKLGFFRGFYRKKISFIFQDYKLIPHLNVFENVSLPLRIRDIPGWKDKTLKSMEYVGIKHLAKQYPYQISGGESQRTSIARALSIEPQIIFADEPTGNLDTETEKEIMQVFKNIHQNLNITFIIVTHEADIIELSNRHFILKEGLIFETDN